MGRKRAEGVFFQSFCLVFKESFLRFVTNFTILAKNMFKFKFLFVVNNRFITKCNVYDWWGG